MTIDIITALDQAFYQAETAENDVVRKHAIQHFINVASIMEQQLQVAGIKEVRIGGESVLAVPTEQLARQMEAQLPPKPVRTYQTGVRGLGDPGLQWTPVAASEQPVPPAPAPDVIDMTDPRNWQAGDVVQRGEKGWFWFRPYEEYVVTVNDGKTLEIKGECGVVISYPFDSRYSQPASNFFTWLRHGDAPTTQA